MTDQEKQDLIQDAKDGSQSAIEAVERKYIRFAWTFARRYRSYAEANRAVDLDDLRQLAALGVLLAVRLYDPEKARFLSYVKYTTITLCRRALGLTGRTRREWYIKTSLDAPLKHDEPDGDTIGDTIADPCLPDPDAGIADEQLHAAIDTALGKLPDRQQDIIRRNDLHGETLTSIAESYGICTQAASAARKEGLRRLRHDQLLRDLEGPGYYLHVGVSEYQRTGMSAVERIAERHIEI